MPVYIDNYNAPFRHMTMCHMIADSTNELLEMCRKIGVAEKWIQKKGTVWEHFDVCLSKKEKAITCGAIAVSVRDLALKIRARRERVESDDF